MAEMEIWADIKGYEGYYQVSNHGRVRSIRRVVVHTRRWRTTRILPARILVPQMSGGYYVVRLSKRARAKTIKVHRLVAIAFVPKRYGRPIINHKDGNKLNNLPVNLEWSNNSHNMLHAYELGLKKPAGVALLHKNIA
jgi:NUMOD4 motif-containing protein/HNH endonuclease